MEEELEKSTRLLRKELGSIILDDIEDLKTKEEKLDYKQQEARANDVELFYKKHFERVIKLFIQKQLEEGVKEADTIGKVLFGRGVITGMLLIKEWFEKQVNLSMSKFDEGE